MTLDPTYKYLLGQPIGRGTFSQTQTAAIAQGGDKLMAFGTKPAILKTLDPQLRDRAEFEQYKQHFQQLARRLRQCQHPHLALVLDLFEEDGQPYIVYDAIAGQSLAAMLETEGVLPEAKALRYIQQLAEAVQALHQANLNHLDIQPQNILKRDGSDDLVLIEFGLTCELAPGIKQTHANLLSPGYAAPEQHHPDAPCTPATDIYALAATLYCLLSGSPPPPAPLLEHIPVQTWQQFPPDLSPSTKTAIVQGLALDPAQRPQTVEAWLALLTSPVEEQEPEDPAASDRAPTGTSEPDSRVQVTLEEEETIPEVAEEIEQAVSSGKLQKKRTTPPQKFPVRALLLTCAIAASAGAGFGLSLRFNRPDEAGSSLWHLKQSFPPRSSDSQTRDES
jgi:eukaryotic-like serine/threonine-protein kinase